MLQGQIHPDFGEVATILSKVLPRGEPGGGAVCVYHRGEPVVDVWGGTRDDAGNPWEESTLAMSYSTTKGILATLVHMQVDRGRLDYDAPVAKYWPEFEASGKQGVTVRHLLCHEAGLFAIRGLIDDASRMLDWEYMTRALARAAPIHPPGEAHGYHGLTFGWLVGELLQRATGKSLAHLLQQELAGPLGLDGLFVGLPDSELPRTARLLAWNRVQDRSRRGATERSDERRGFGSRLNRLLQSIGFPIDFACFGQALLPSGIERFDWNRPEVLGACIPAANGVFTARSLARVYAALANGGKVGNVRLVHEPTLQQLSRIQNRGLDKVLPAPMHWRLGYHRIIGLRPRLPHAFGHLGLGGSGALAEPKRGLSVALVTNYGIGTPIGDTRVLRLAQAAARCADRR